LSPDSLLVPQKNAGGLSHPGVFVERQELLDLGLGAQALDHLVDLL